MATADYRPGDPSVQDRPVGAGSDGGSAGGPDRWGIHRDWVDAHGQRQQISDAAVDRLRAVIGEPPADLDDRAPIVTRPGRSHGLGDVDVTCEDGSVRQVGDPLPGDFPLGYHQASTPDGVSRRLIVSPGRCWLPEVWRAWGWAMQLYSTRSRESWGIGDLGDLGRLRAWAEAEGAGFLILNPLHAVAPTMPQENSPYLPATRRFRNPIYLNIPGDEGLDVNQSELIDRDAVWERKLAVLSAEFETTPVFEQWRAEQGQPLRDWSLWCALTEKHGPDWREWEEPLRDPRGEAVSDFEHAHADRVAFFAWLQWMLDGQVREATGEMPVIQDLPIGVDGGGADAWAWQQHLAGGVTVGAPPDIFNPNGQSWGSPPFIPWRLRAADYQPFIESIRATMAGAGGVRIDHVMGLFRLWWVPEDGSPDDGAYIRYPSADLLDIVALESHRAQAIVVGEDLGTVEPGVREALAEHRILSYRLLWFADEDPKDWPASSMAAVSTHDLPTIAGLWSGDDMAEQSRETGVAVHDLTGGRDEILGRLRRDGLSDAASAAEAIEAAYRMLARAPSVLLSATLEDAVGQVRRPNMPGTTERENWRLPLPVLIEDLPDHPGVVAVMAALRGGVD